MALNTIARSLSSSAAAAAAHLKSYPPSSSLFLRIGFFSTSADHYCHLLHLYTGPNPTATPHSDLQTNLEASLSQTLTLTLTNPASSLHFTIVDSVLRHFTVNGPATNSIVILRFFVWAGQQRTCRHSAASYSEACEHLDLSRNPNFIPQLLDAYRRDRTAVSVRTFKVILDLCVQANLRNEALEVLRRMGEFNCCPHTSNYNAVIRLLVRSGCEGDLDLGMKILEEMALCGVQPDVVSYVLMVKGLCGVNRLEDARLLVAQMKDRGCLPNVVVYSALVDGACKNGDFDLAMKMMEEMQVNVVSHTCLIHCLCEKGRVEDALKVFDKMPKRRLLPNRVTVKVILRALCDGGRVDDAYKLVERVVSEMCVSSRDGYSSLVISLLESRNVEEAERLVEKMTVIGVELDGAALNSFIRGFCSTGRFLDAFSWVSKLWKKSSSFDSEVYTVLAAGLCGCRHLIEAASIVRGMAERGLPLESSFVNSLASLLNDSGETELAMEVLSSSKQA